MKNKMKRITTLLAALSWACLAFAQEATTTWPYIYPAFREGTVNLVDGKARAQQLNIHLRHDALHYLDKDGKVMQAYLQDVVGVQIGEDAFLKVGDEMMKVVATSERGCVVAEILGDYAALTETGGAYGTSSTTSATRKLSSIETDAQINQNHMLLLQSKSEGQALGVITRYFLVWNGQSLPATRHDVEKAVPAERAGEWKAWRKANKVKWNRPESLVSLLEFLNP